MKFKGRSNLEPKISVGERKLRGFKKDQVLYLNTKSKVG